MEPLSRWFECICLQQFPLSSSILSCCVKSSIPSRWPQYIKTEALWNHSQFGFWAKLLCIHIIHPCPPKPLDLYEVRAWFDGGCTWITVDLSDPTIPFPLAGWGWPISIRPSMLPDYKICPSHWQTQVSHVMKHVLLHQQKKTVGLKEWTQWPCTTRISLSHQTMFSCSTPDRQRMA